MEEEEEVQDEEDDEEDMQEEQETHRLIFCKSISIFVWGHLDRSWASLFSSTRRHRRPIVVKRGALATRTKRRRHT